jgi:hypothetical protein
MSAEIHKRTAIEPQAGGTANNHLSVSSNASQTVNSSTIAQSTPAERIHMKTITALTAAAISALLAFSASAEQYQGVLTLKSSSSRAEAHSEAVRAAQGADPYREGASAGPASVFSGRRDRATVRSEALAAAIAGNIYADGSFAGVAPSSTGNIDRQAVRAEARATAARGITEGTL